MANGQRLHGSARVRRFIVVAGGAGSLIILTTLHQAGSSGHLAVLVLAYMPERVPGSSPVASGCLAVSHYSLLLVTEVGPPGGAGHQLHVQRVQLRHDLGGGAQHGSGGGGRLGWRVGVAAAVAARQVVCAHV